MDRQLHDLAAVLSRHATRGCRRRCAGGRALPQSGPPAARRAVARAARLPARPWSTSGSSGEGPARGMAVARARKTKSRPEPLPPDMLAGRVARLRPLRAADRATSVRWRNDPDIRDNVLGYRFPITAP